VHRAEADIVMSYGSMGANEAENRFLELHGTAGPVVPGLDEVATAEASEPQEPSSPHHPAPGAALSFLVGPLNSMR
jgi:hypothetical protein